MTLHGIVRGNCIELTEGAVLPDGAAVTIGEVTITSPNGSAAESEPHEEPSDGYALNRAMMRFAGMVKDMPEDASINMDHYLYGAPKR
jgi:hypothetical protein